MPDFEHLKKAAWESTTMYPRDLYAGAWARGADDMIAALRPEIAKLAEFARAVITTGCFDGCEIDGGCLQELALRHGLLKEVAVQEPCAPEGPDGYSDCNCLFQGADFPTICYRFTDVVGEAHPAVQPEEQR